MSKVWLVTGSASGLGRSIAQAVLVSGDRLVATARDPLRLADLVQRYGNQVRTAPLDVADENAAKAAVQTAVDAFGRLDVVVNNAGYGDIAPFEQLSSERFKAVVDTNLYGVVNVTRAALPIMRKQKSGCVLQIIVSGRSPRAAREHSVPCCQVGCWGVHRVPRPRSGPLWGQGVCARTRRNADELGRSCAQRHTRADPRL
jgi:NAD(P)-dependent dehydrogenase (short-subunit alcohol dehydrogenase family)